MMKFYLFETIHRKLYIDLKQIESIELEEIDNDISQLYIVTKSGTKHTLRLARESIRYKFNKVKSILDKKNIFSFLNNKE